MPKPDYKYSTSIIIGCPGGGDGETLEGPEGELRSRAGAKLANVEADCAYWKQNMLRAGSNSAFDLGNASGSELISALFDAVRYLNEQRLKEDANGGQLDLIFSGHGTEDGALSLRDRSVAIDEIIDVVAANVVPGVKRLRISLVFDCCFSGYGLARFVTHPEHGRSYLVIDGFAAALHDEKAYELTSLQHGVLTYAMKNRGNAHVDTAQLAWAVNNNDDRILRAALQCWAPNPATYLTRGKQHSVEVINGHYFTVHGLGDIELESSDVRTVEVLHAFEALRARSNMQETITL